MVFSKLINYTPEIRDMKKSELMKIIREEVEVVLTNAEATEMFDLDPAALLDEIVSEELPSLEETLYDDRYDDVERMRPRRYRSEEELEDIRRDMKQREKDREHRAWLQRRKDAGLDEEKDDWIQDAEADIERRGTEGVCTGEKFGSDSCPPGSKRYNLAKTFRKMAKKRKKD